MFGRLSALYALMAIPFIGCAQQYPTEAQRRPCVNNCVQNCAQQTDPQRCDQFCQQPCAQSAGRSPQEPVLSNNQPIYLRPGSSQHTPLIGNIDTRQAQSQPLVQSVERVRGTVTSRDIACRPICMPSCTRKCVHQESIASHVAEGPIPVTGEQLAPVISQRPGPMVPQETMPMIPSQDVIEGPGSIIADGSMPLISQQLYSTLPQLINSITPSQDVQKSLQFPKIMPQTRECLPACIYACSTQCTQQGRIISRVIESPMHSTPAAAYVPMSGSGTPTLQQPTNECVAACIPICNAECIRDQPQPPLSVAPNPASVQPQPMPLQGQSSPFVPAQSSTTECLPSTLETECACPRGFTVCVTASGSNQCCRRR
uniref:Uncharacterized protein n=1 Tax=Parascaris univalens TaxID=6257 RepID=A0A915B4D2_PARUN